MVSYRFFPEDEQTQERFTTRPPKSPFQSLRSRLWVLWLMERCDVLDLAPLNAQLTLPPARDGFVLGLSPQPLTELSKEDRIFEGPLERGTDPAGKYFGKRDDLPSGASGTSSRFSLAERVEEHIPGSRDWLMEPMAPYLECALPPVSYALDVRRKILSQLGLRQIGAAATEFGLAHAEHDVTRVAQGQYQYLAKLTNPLHLPLLITILHEQCWHDPHSGSAADASRYTVEAFDQLLRHPMMARHQLGKLVQSDLGIMRFLIPYTAKQDGAHSHPAPGMERPSTSVPILFCRNFDDFEDARYVASLGLIVPWPHYDRTVHSKFYRTDKALKPSREESLRALAELLQHADLT